MSLIKNDGFSVILASSGTCADKWRPIRPISRCLWFNSIEEMHATRLYAQDKLNRLIRKTVWIEISGCYKSNQKWSRTNPICVTIFKNGLNSIRNTKTNIYQIFNRHKLWIITNVESSQLILRTTFYQVPLFLAISKKCYMSQCRKELGIFSISTP